MEPKHRLGTCFHVERHRPAYGPPTNYQGAHCRLFENDGKGAFRDVSAERGIEVVNPATNLPLGKALALTICDFDRDGWLDVMVANDTVQNFMFHNQEGSFVEIGAFLWGGV